MYCHQGDGAVNMLCRPQSNVLVRERFSLRVRSGFASLSDQCVGGDSGVFFCYPESMARLVLVLGVCAWDLVRERVLPPGGWRGKDTL